MTNCFPLRRSADLIFAGERPLGAAFAQHMMRHRIERLAGGLFGFRIGHGEAPSDGPYPAIAIAPNIGAAPPGRKGWAVSAGRSASRARSFAPAKENVLQRGARSEERRGGQASGRTLRNRR